MRTWFRVLFFMLLALAALPSRADVILTLDFDAVLGGGQSTTTSTYTEDGFRVYSLVLPSTNPSAPFAYYQGHYDLWCGLMGACGPIGSNPAYDGSHWLGTDAGLGCTYYDAGMNELALPGNCQGVIRIDRNGETFSALDLINVLGGWTLTSSAGGTLSGIPMGPAAFVGAQWQNIQWLDLTVNIFAGSPLGFDTLRVQVPEPPLVALLGAAMVGVALAARRRRAR